MFAEKIELIQNITIKAQFKEINKCIENESYRAAVVLLWSAVVLDLITKVQELSDVYGNSTATNVLEELKDEWEKNPKSPEWEKSILKDSQERLNIISLAQYNILSNLHTTRHLCAHPVKDSVWDLYTPSKNEVLYFYEYALDLAIIPAYLSQKSFEGFLDDVAKNYAVYGDSFSEFLETKYYRIIDERTQKYYFKNLWKFCFKLDNDDCRKNREINVKALYTLMKMKGRDFVEMEILSNKKSFSDIELTNENIVTLFIWLMMKVPYAFNFLEETTRKGVKNIVAKTSKYSTLCFFVQPSFEDHVELLDQRPISDEDESKELNVDSLSELIGLDGIRTSVKNKLLSLAIKCYVKSYEYNYADKVFNLLIYPNLGVFSDFHLKELVDGMSENCQTYERRNAPYDHRKILDELQKRNFGQQQIEKMKEILSRWHY